MSFYRDLSKQYGDSEVKGSRFWVLNCIIEASRVSDETHVNDVACFHYLSHLSSIIEQELDGQDLVDGQFFVGLERTTYARSWDKSELQKTLRHWVGPNKPWANQPHVREWVKQKLSELKSRWQRVAPCRTREYNKTFKEFCEDPTMWATSGGGPHIEWEGVDYRSKWAWAMWHLSHSHDLYSEALRYPNVAHAALKEEPKKTRLVITTPMSSYLRQAYALYLVGEPPIHSPIYSDKELDEITGIVFNSYMSIDAKNFDQQIPLWLILDIVNMVFDLAGLEELRREEISHIRHLNVELFGVFQRYEGGVLSGWRLTSVIGSIASELLCEWIRTRCDCKYIVQGDDVLLYSGGWINEEVVKQSMDEFGLVYNGSETNVRKTGTFLRRVYGTGETRMSAGRALRQLFYASPWVERSQFTTPSSLAGGWKQLISRIPGNKPREWLLHQAASDMARWARWPGWTAGRWYELFTTDMGLGGLGTIDTHITRPYVPQIIERAGAGYVRKVSNDWHRLLHFFVPTHGMVSSHTQQSYYQYHQVGYIPICHQTIPDLNRKLWDDWDNKTITALAIMRNGVSAATDNLKRAIPHWMRMHPWWVILSWIFRQDSITTPASLAVPPRVVRKKLSTEVQHCSAMMRNHRGNTKFFKLCLYNTVLCFSRLLNIFPIGSW